MQGGAVPPPPGVKAIDPELIKKAEERIAKQTQNFDVADVAEPLTDDEGGTKGSKQMPNMEAMQSELDSMAAIANGSSMTPGAGSMDASNMWGMDPNMMAMMGMDPSMMASMSNMMASSSNDASSMDAMQQMMGMSGGMDPMAMMMGMSMMQMMTAQR